MSNHLHINTTTSSAAAAATRRRRRRQRKDNEDDDIAGSSDGKNDSLLDSDDQARLVSNMAAELERQQLAIQQAFRMVCIGAAGVSLLCSLLVQLRARKNSSSSQHNTVTAMAVVLLRWIHAILAAALHGAASYLTSACLPSTSSTTTSLKWILYIPFAIMLLVAANSLFLLRHLAAQHEQNSAVDVSSYYDESIWLHQGMLLANVLTAAAGLWLRYDRLSMNQSLEELRKSQYRYKSL